MLVLSSVYHGNRVLAGIQLPAVGCIVGCTTNERHVVDETTVSDLESSMPQADIPIRSSARSPADISLSVVLVFVAESGGWLGWHAIPTD